MYKSRFMVDDVLETAAAQGFDVMRVWGSLDVGDPNDNSTSIAGGPKEGVYLHYWDRAAQAPAFNDGPNGLERLDYMIAKAGELGLKLVIPFVNNWNDFGGMDQYVRWRDLSTPAGQTWYHDSFYTDPVIKGWYKDWISHLLNRTNTITGVNYKDDPTIMTWELGERAALQERRRLRARGPLHHGHPDSVGRRGVDLREARRPQPPRLGRRRGVLLPSRRQPLDRELR